MSKPVLYLDVDGVLIQFREDRTRLHYEMHKGGFPANRVGDFLKWADENFEVRWLTSWAMHGVMRPERKLALEAILWETLPNWDNPLSWASGEKVDGIDYKDPRTWFWVDDETKRDRPLLPENYGNRLIKTNSSVNPNALCYTALELYYRRGMCNIAYPEFASDYEYLNPPDFYE